MTGKENNTNILTELEALRKEVQQLREANTRLIARNMVLAEQVEMGYEVRRRIDWLKELIRKHREFMDSADRTDDAELLAIIETRLEQENIPLPPDFGIRQIAELAGVTQGRIAELYKTKTIYRSVDEYLDFLRLMRTLRMLHDNPGYNIAACAQEAGFASVRTFYRKFQDAFGLSPHEFRKLVE
ncbi:MAG: helix-turn-helix domain-containing protein [Prevotella sp.]